MVLLCGLEILLLIYLLHRHKKNKMEKESLERARMAQQAQQQQQPFPQDRGPPVGLGPNIQVPYTGKKGSAADYYQPPREFDPSQGGERTASIPKFVKVDRDRDHRARSSVGGLGDEKVDAPPPYRA